MVHTPPPWQEARTNHKHALAKDQQPAGQSTRSSRWFRPGHGLWTTEMLAVAHKAGYRTALGSIWPYDTHIHFPLLNALYIWCKVHSGAVVVLHDRRRHTAATLSWLLPWLRWSGYRVCSLSEAEHLAAVSSSDLTTEALAEHNYSHSQTVSSGSGNSEAGMQALEAMEARMQAVRTAAGNCCPPPNTPTQKGMGGHKRCTLHLALIRTP